MLWKWISKYSPILAVYTLWVFANGLVLGTEEKKNNLEKTFQMVSTPGSETGPYLFEIWVLSPLRHPCQRGYVRTEATFFLRFSHVKLTTKKRRL